ncbi:cell division ATP-binding protein FtsE [Leptolyngbya sp. FACHB-261]|uniref:cell division ATP-binding protein FtsE n=1 Tax=Leptolyngbya sp. FACHB-261 TaxID=2692806 RepID=UPI001684EB57|nr:cell division ATP-binding protein FtsE [Leptolyngbya sp. FACHB-261]MBD2102085.1 cell division ATP-binding protein FtsE [Leptolyngbya sp. FACHB-261]
MTQAPSRPPLHLDSPRRVPIPPPLPVRPGLRTTGIEIPTAPVIQVNPTPAPLGPLRPTLIRLASVVKTYQNGSPSLKGVDLEVRQGDFLFVTGPSGSGKSTLLKLLYGEERVCQGEITVDGFDLSRVRGRQLAMLRRRIGIVFQDYKLIPRRTVSENVAFVLRAQGFDRKEIRRRLAPALRMVGLCDKADRFPEELSGGEQQRVSIARAIVGTPPLLLADEPTGNLDAANAWQVIKILKKLNSFGVTVIVTTHDENLVRISNHPVVQLRAGQLHPVRDL